MRGASTISQQVAKNLFLWPSRSLTRKGLEAWFTAWLELVWSKRRILEAYLNVAQFGPCLFGAGAASDRYFNTEAIALSPHEAALLATVLPNPKRLRAHDPGPYARERSAEILELMNWHRDKAIGTRLSRIASEEN
jgi:monofunctional biosynthetic peptidoglycan transglycosylase